MAILWKDTSAGMFTDRCEECKIKLNSGMKITGGSSG